MDEDTQAVLELLKIKAYLVREYSNKRLAVHTKDTLDRINGALDALDQGGSINMDEDTQAVLELLKIKAYLVREYSNKRLAVHTKDMLDRINGALDALDHERKL